MTRRHQRRATLDDAVKAFIVHKLACFDTPSEVADAVQGQFGVTIARQVVECYDPTKYAGRRLSKKWRVHFDIARKAFREKVADIPIAHRVCRLRALQRMVERAEATRNYALAAALLEQAAQEVGDAYTNRRMLGARTAAAVRTAPATA